MPSQSLNFEAFYIPIQNDQIQADLYIQPNSTQATIIMAHGLGGEKNVGLGEFDK